MVQEGYADAQKFHYSIPSDNMPQKKANEDTKGPQLDQRIHQLDG